MTEQCATLKIPLITWKPTEEERAAVNDVFNSGQLTYGKYCRLVEKEFPKITNCLHGVLSNSGTSSLLVALLALKEKYKLADNAPVICPAVTFVASLNVIVQAGLKPVLCDVDENGYLDYLQFEELAERQKPVIILLPHLWGNPYPYARSITDYCKDKGALLVEDSCETVHPSVGCWGQISCFSFYMCHILSGGVGGISCTNDPELEKIMRSLVNHGMRDVFVQPVAERFTFDRVGYSSRITEFEAALIHTQLNIIDGLLESRKQVSGWIRRYIHEMNLNFMFRSVGGLMMYPLVINEGLDIDKKMLLQYLDENGIEARHMMPLTNQETLMKKIFGTGFNPRNWPMADMLNRRGFYVPVHQHMTEADCIYIAEKLSEARTKAAIWQK